MLTTHCHGVWAPKEVSTMTLVMAAVFLVLTIPGNLLVVIAVLKNANQDMRTPFCAFILCLSVTDLLVGLLVEPLSMFTHWREINGLPLSLSWLSQLIYFLGCTASLLCLTALTVARYISITSPLWYRTHATFKNAIYVSCGVWLAALAFSLTFFEVGFITYSFVLANLALFFSLSILVFGYVRIFLKLQAQLEDLRQYETESEQNRTRMRTIEREKKITKTYLMMIAAFVLTYGPSCIMVYFMNLCTMCSCELIHWLRDLHFVFVTCNSFVNPMLYAFRLPHFRKAFIQIFSCCRRGSAVEPSHPPVTRVSDKPTAQGQDGET